MGSFDPSTAHRRSSDALIETRQNAAGALDRSESLVGGNLLHINHLN